MAIEIALVLFLLIIVGSWALFTAQRLNSLHIRTDASLAQLQAALDRRAQTQGTCIADRFVIKAMSELDAPLGVGKRSRAALRGKLPHDGGG